ncbi:MAG: hypothetical protein GY696_31025, partial [Gammaproteobacteria bacterium]|nr:hypothetical protein [Gammaproteobacteria bacterium]
NLPTGGAQDVILVFGFELKTDESPITVLRTRLSPNLITADPGSDGTLAGGEVEDQQVPAGILPTLAGSDYDDAPASYGEAAHSAIASTLYIGATAPDGETAGFDTANSNGDDNDGTDDEDDITLALYKQGMSCTGTDGTYTTGTPLIGGEYCMVVSATNTTGSDAQLVGWLDFDGNGTFDSYERSIVSPVGTNSTAVDDGTFATGNLPTGGTRDVILAFSGFTTKEQNPAIVLRTRVSTDASFFASPSATGTVTGGEVEDQQVAQGTLPVILSYFKSSLQGTKVTAQWGTGSELFNIGFQAWAEDKDSGKWYP